MKNGYKHKTGIFGTAAENYVSRLFMLLRNPNGDRRPDLVSIDGRYNPVLSLEVKSGRKKKGVLVDYQLHYAVTTEQAYMELFGEKPPKREITASLFPESSMPETSRLLPGDPVAYYYCLIDRIDELKADDIDRPYSSIKCQWGDMFIVPPEFAFYSFAACRVKRSGEEMDKVVDELKEMVERDSVSWSSANYNQRKGHIYSWQNLQGRDIQAVFEDDLNVATIDGKDRINLISQAWPTIKNLKRIKMSGPNDTSIYVLANPEDKSLFHSQVRNTIETRTPIIEKVYRARNRAVPLLDGIPLFGCTNGLLFDQGAWAKRAAKNSLSISEIMKLERLVNWLDKGEKKLDLSPF